MTACKIFAGRPDNYMIAQKAGEHMLYKMDTKKICEYIDRIGRPSSKDTDKRKDPASSIR
jgi:hypothetical protein